MAENKCRVCGDKTETIFNIDFKATPICEGCAGIIFLQQAQWYSQQEYQKINVVLINNQMNKFNCDSCGCETDGEKYPVYDENYNKQHGVVECEKCFKSKVDE